MFSGFTKSVTSLVTSHPAVAFATAFAAVAAPAFLKDENRGYLRTAITTAPIVAAMGIAGPGLVTSASRAVRSGYRFVREMPQVFNKNYSVDYRQLHTALHSGEIDLGVINPALRNWVDEEAINFFSLADRGAPPIEYSMESALELFDRLAPDEGKRTLLTYAIEGARQRAASPVQLAGVANVNVLAPMSSSELRGIINQNRADPRFVEEFSRRLRWAGSLQDVGALIQPLNLGTNQITKLGYDEGFRLLQAQRPAVAESLQAAVRANVVDEAVVIAEQTTSGEIGRLLGVNLKRGSKELQMPLFDPASGSVRLGEKFQRVGVGRRIYNKQGIYDLDLFVAQNLTQDWNILEKDIARAAYFGGIDPLNEYKMATHLESQMASLSPQAMYMASRRAVPTTLPVFGEGVEYSKLPTPEKVAFIRRLMSGGLGQPMTAIGSEGGMRKGSFEFGELELFTPGGLPSRAKQAYAYRAFSKELQLAPGSIPEGWRPRVVTSAAEAIGGLPEVRMTVAGITPQQRALFGDLPRNITDLPAYEETAIKRIMDDTGLSYAEAKAAWGKVAGKLTAREGFYGAAQRLGYLGEGGVLLHGKFGRLRMEARTTMRVNELHLTPEQLAGKAPISPNQLIGFSGLEPITSSAPETFVEKASSIGNQFELMLRQQYPVETGAKIDIAGKKGLVAVAGYDAASPELDEFAKIRELLNVYGEATGAPVAIPQFADAIAPLHYMQGDLGDPFRTLMEQAAEVSAQLVAAPGESVMVQAMGKAGLQPEILDQVNKYMFDMSTKGWDVNAQRFMENSDIVSGTADRAARIRGITDRTAQFLEDVGTLARQNAPGTGGELFGMYRRTGMTSFTEFMQRNAMVAGAGFWDTTRRNVPLMTSATFDLFSEMYRAGNVEGIKEIMSRLEFQGGAPEMAADFARQFVGQEFTKPMGTVIPISEAAPGGVQLGTMEGRAGSIFDPNRAGVGENFSLALREPIYARIAGRDVEVTHVPVLGKQAYGGGANLFEKPGEGLAYGATDYEKALADVVRFQTDPVQLSAAVSQYFDETYRTLFGKTGFYRAKGTDVMGGVSGFLQTRASPADPFQLVISEQMARRVRDKQIRRALGMEVDVATGMEVLAHPGMEAMATLGRHPIQAAPYMRVRVAPEAGLGPNMIGMDERIRALFGADDDKDILNLFFYRNGTQAEREALAAVNNLNSNQWRSLKTLEMLYGASEDSRNITKARLEQEFLTLPQQVEKGLAAAGMEGGRTQQVINRLAAEKVGAYSNLVTQLYTNLEMHPTIGMNPEAEMQLGHMFWPVRQFTIAAAKSKAAMDPELAMVPYQRIRAGLRARNAEGVGEVIGGLEAIYRAFNKKSILTEQSAKIYSEMTGKPGIAGEEVDALMDVLHSERGKALLSDFVINRNVQADRMAQLVTKQVGEMEGSELYALQAMYNEAGNAMPYVRGLVKESRSGRVASRVLGAINETLRTAARELPKGDLGVLGLGLGLTAAAGLLTTRLKPMAKVNAVFGQTAGSFRPEERLGTTDQPLGEPYPGSMSSVNPPRRQLPPRRGVGTTMVAPMHQRNDLEVRMRAQNRQDTMETQRMVSQISGGPGVQNITVNYRNGWRNKMSRLRQRETIREQLGS
jgi:hypothetical protein